MIRMNPPIESVLYQSNTINSIFYFFGDLEEGKHKDMDKDEVWALGMGLEKGNGIDYWEE